MAPIQCINLMSFHWKKHVFYLTLPLFVSGISQKKSVDLHFLLMTSSLLYCLQSPKWTVSFFCVPSHIMTVVFVFLSMLIICPRWIQYFSWFSTLTRSSTQMHKASELLDSFFFAPQEREMIWDDAILHKQLTSPCSYSSSPILSFMTKIHIMSDIDL